MSLTVDGRSRSRSASRDRRSRDDAEREAPRTYADASSVYPDDHVDLGYRYGPGSRQDLARGGGLPYPDHGGIDSMVPGRQSLYNYDDPRPFYRAASPATHPDDGESRARYAEPADSRYGGAHVPDDRLRFLPHKYSRHYDDDADDRRSGHDRKRDRRPNKDVDDDDLAYGRLPPSPSPNPASPAWNGGSAGYLSASQKRSSKSGRDDGDDRRRRSHRDSYRGDPRDADANVIVVEPASRDGDRSRHRRRDKSPDPSSLAPQPDRRDRSRSRDRRASTRDKSPQPPTARMSTLTVDAARTSGLSSSLAAAPASPLLESYRGTYQDCSPMPSPLLLASQAPGDDARAIDPLSPPLSDAEREAKKTTRRARFHDAEDIASRLAQALRGGGPPDVQPLIEILPSLTHDQVMELRTEYKRLVKTGSAHKGVNVAKHIRARLKDEDPSLMKACYAVALGRWESEAYWASFWYQGDKTRRELLIEALMGRSNHDIRRIKDAFTDKKYDNSLVRCMKTELKEDKFKKAVLMVLEERRMDDFDHHGLRLPLDYGLVDRDVDDLRRAVKAERGGESAMAAIVVRRSDAHLRAVLNEYERRHRANFARDALKKSGNLVGELLAHVLNGVINRPVRDALLLHHALSASRRDDLRRELLASRLVRFHWDAAHMHAVRRAFRERYGVELQDAVREATTGAWGRFCGELCIARMPDDVRRM